jgi:hypothetical protein
MQQLRLFEAVEPQSARAFAGARSLAAREHGNVDAAGEPSANSRHSGCDRAAEL